MMARSFAKWLRLKRAAWPLVILLNCLGTGHSFVWNTDSTGARRQWPVASPSLVATNILNPSTRAIRYFLGAEGYSTSNSVAELNAIRSAFGQWQSIPGTVLQFEEGGVMTGPVDINTSDGTNVVFWARTNAFVNGGRDHILGTLALTYPRVLESNVLAEADIVLNGLEVGWFTDASETNNASQYVESTLLHEIGHFIGLDHSPIGAATMFVRSTAGIGSQAGLADDEVSAARTLYPRSALENGMLRGRIQRGGSPVFGAIVIAENEVTGQLSGTVTLADGTFDLGVLPPGTYQVRAVPCDPPSNNSLNRLLTGAEIAPAFQGAALFLPTPNRAVIVKTGETAEITLDVVLGAPPFRITRIETPTMSSTPVDAFNAPVAVWPGQSNLYVGVLSPNLPLSNASLTISGPGIRAGAPLFRANAFPGTSPPVNLISVPIDVDVTAPPGPRTFTVVQGTNLAYANGFLDVLPSVPDANFDGLDDRFQRRYFPLFTAPEAGPGADPDHDGLDNKSEYATGTNPEDSGSVLRLESIRISGEGTLLRWQSVPGKQYRILSRSAFGAGLWQVLSDSIVSGSQATEFLDTSNRSGTRFYRVETGL